MSRAKTPPASPCLQCPRCASRVVHPVLPTSDVIELRCDACGTVWTVPLPPRASRVARFSIARLNVWRSALERRRRAR